MRKLKASLLTECSIGIFILGLILTLSIQYWKINNYEKNLLITEKKIHDIKIALQGYVIRYGFLPNASNNSEGIEIKGCLIGMIPYKTLGLSSSYLKDGFGNIFQFIVNENLTLDYNIKNEKKIVPIFMPLTYIYHNSTVSWHRIYKFSEPFVIYDYEDINITKNINLFKNNQKIKMSYLECDRPFVPILLYNSQNIEKTMIEFDASKKYYKVNDLVAWVIIFGKTKNKNHLNIELNKNVFFQTRFNLSSSLKYSTSSDFSYLSQVDNYSLQLKNFNN